MEEAGIAVNPQDMILGLRMDLLSAYNAIIINFDSTHTDQLMFDNVIIQLLNEEVHQKTGTPPVKISPDQVKNEPLDTAHIAMAHPTPHLEIICHFCDKKGHFKVECQDKQRWDNSKKDGMNALW